MRELSDLSLWHATMTDDEWGPARSGLPGNQQVDVAIVGAGYTGLWTAYYLLQRDPKLRVAILEASAAISRSPSSGGPCLGVGNVTATLAPPVRRSRAPSSLSRRRAPLSVMTRSPGAAHASNSKS